MTRPHFLYWLLGWRKRRRPTNERRYLVITQEQLKQLQEKVTALVTDKGTADAATQASNTKDASLAKATADANQAKLDEAQADAKVTADVTDLQAFIGSLTSGPVPAP